MLTINDLEVSRKKKSERKETRERNLYNVSSITNITYYSVNNSDYSGSRLKCRE